MAEIRESKVDSIINTSLDNLRQIVDVNTVVGDPVTTASGTVVIPISKVSMGFVSGGTEYASKRPADKPAQNFAGSDGTGVTLLPLGFLIVKAEGDVEFIPVEVKTSSDGPVGSIVGLIEKSPDIAEKFKKLFSKKGKEKETETVTETSTETVKTENGENSAEVFTKSEQKVKKSKKNSDK